MTNERRPAALISVVMKISFSYNFFSEITLQLAFFLIYY